MDNTIINAISSVGFPIVVTLYLLIRFQASMDRFSRKVDELIIEIRKEMTGGRFYLSSVDDSRTVPAVISATPSKWRQTNDDIR